MDSGTFTYLKRFVGLEIGNCMVSSGVAKRDLFPEIRRLLLGILSTGRIAVGWWWNLELEKVGCGEIA